MQLKEFVLKVLSLNLKFYINILDHGIDKYFKILGYNYDANLTRFLSVIEGKQYPFYGT